MGSIPNWRAERPTRAVPTVAPLPLGISVDTGTHERVANWSPDSVAAVDPCDPGHRPKERPFCRYHPRRYLFNLDIHGNVPEAVVVRGGWWSSLSSMSRCSSSWYTYDGLRGNFFNLISPPGYWVAPPGSWFFTPGQFLLALTVRQRCLLPGFCCQFQLPQL